MPKPIKTQPLGSESASALPDEVALRSKRGKRSKTKGKVFERKLVQLIQARMPDKVKVERGYWQAHRQAGGAAVVPDIVMPVFWVEAKCGKKRNMREALAQSVKDAESVGSSKIPVAVVRDDNAGSVVVMRLEDWLDILEAMPREIEASEWLSRSTTNP